MIKELELKLNLQVLIRQLDLLGARIGRSRVLRGDEKRQFDAILKALSDLAAPEAGEK